MSVRQRHLFTLVQLTLNVPLRLFLSCCPMTADAKNTVFSFYFHRFCIQITREIFPVFLPGSFCGTWLVLMPGFSLPSLSCGIWCGPCVLSAAAAIFLSTCTAIPACIFCVTFLAIRGSFLPCPVFYGHWRGGLGIQMLLLCGLAPRVNRKGT